MNYLEMVKTDGMVLGGVPEEFLLKEICWAAVRQNGWVLSAVPEDLKTAEMCLEAVRKEGWLIQYVPEAVRTAELCLEAAIRSEQEDNEMKALTIEAAAECLGYSIEYIDYFFQIRCHDELVCPPLRGDG